MLKAHLNITTAVLAQLSLKMCHQQTSNPYAIMEDLFPVELYKVLLSHTSQVQHTA